MIYRTLAISSGSGGRTIGAIGAPSKTRAPMEDKGAYGEAEGEAIERGSPAQAMDEAAE
jgi:hypothetical protein